jgi:hypothetical protein
VRVLKKKLGSKPHFMIPERAKKKRKKTRTSAQVLYLHANNLTSSAVIKIFFPIRKTLKHNEEQIK